MDKPTRPIKFCFGPEDEDSIEGMKKLVVEEVQLFRAEIGAHARATGRVYRRNGWTPFELPSHAPGFENTFCILHFADPPLEEIRAP